MSTIIKNPDDGNKCLCTDLGSDGVFVLWFMRRFKELSTDASADVVMLLETYANIGEDDIYERDEILRTLTEILFPETIGKVVEGSPKLGPIPDKVSKRISWIGKKVKQCREAKGWNQKQLSEKSGLSQPQISRLESGVHSPSHKTLDKIVNALGISIGELDPSY